MPRFFRAVNDRYIAMPIYEYRCQGCGAELEKLQKISDPPLSECPECGRETLQKLVSASSFRLKGGGWYESDFKTGNKKNGVGDASAEKGADKGSDKGDGATSDNGKAASGQSDNSKNHSKTDAKQPDGKQEKPPAKAGSTAAPTGNN